MKKIILMISLIAIGIGYAGVLNYYGKIVGTVNIQPPVFYASTKSVEYGYELSINTLPNEYKGELFSVASVKFYSLPLGVSNWYPSKWKIIIHYDNSNSSNILIYSLYFSNNQLVHICSGNVNLEQGTNKVVEIECNFSGGSIPGDSSLWLILTSSKGFDKLYVDGSTRIEVTKVSWTN